MLSSGDIILTKIQFADSFKVKIRPALVLFEEFNNIVVAGITSNLKMRGIPLTKKEGAIKNSVIKLNYIFTISDVMISKKLFALTAEKKKLIFEKLSHLLEPLVTNR